MALPGNVKSQGPRGSQTGHLTQSFPQFDFSEGASPRPESLPSLGAQLENSASTFLESAFDPSASAGMTAAGFSFQAGRLLSLRTALRHVRNPLLARGLGATGGFLLEVPTFVGTTKGANALRGRPVDLRPKTLWQEMKGAGLVLGALKLSGAGSTSALKKFYGGQAIPQWTQIAATQTAMLGGLMSAHSLEARHLHQENLSLNDNLYQSLATLLQFNLAGALLPHLSPELHYRSKQMEIYSQGLPQKSLLANLSSRDHPLREFAWEGPQALGMEEVTLPHLVFNEGKINESSGLPEISPRPNYVEEARRAARKIHQAQRGEISFEEANKTVLNFWRQLNSNKIYPDFSHPELNLITKIFFGKSLSDHALTYRFGTLGLDVKTESFQNSDHVGFTIRLRRGSRPIGSFSVALKLKEATLNGKKQIGWVASRSHLHIHEKWQGYWTLMTLQLADWARTGNFIAIESHSNGDGGKSSISDVFDAADPSIFDRIREGFIYHANRQLGPSEAHWRDKVKDMRHPWEIMDLVGESGEAIGYDCLKNYQDHWVGILPVNFLEGPQWHRLIHRAFVEKKLWNLDERYPSPENTRVGKLETPSDLRAYYLEVASARLLDSLRRMEDHTLQYKFEKDHVWKKIWSPAYQSKIQPILGLMEILRTDIRSLPKQVEAGEMSVEEALRQIEAYQSSVVEFKPALREITVHLEMDYYIELKFSMLKGFYEEFKDTFPKGIQKEMGETLKAMEARRRDLMGPEPKMGNLDSKPTVASLSEKEDYVRELSQQADKHLEDLYLHAAIDLLSKHWNNKLPPKIVIQRFVELLQAGNQLTFEEGRNLKSAASEYAVTLSTLFRDSPWDFKQANSADATGPKLRKNDLYLGIGALRGEAHRNPDKANGAALIERSLDRLRGLRLFFPKFLPLFLVRGSHFKSRILDARGEETPWFIATTPSWGAHEGGIAFSLYHDVQAKKIGKGRAIPQDQVILYINPKGQFILREPYLEKTYETKDTPLTRRTGEALKYLAEAWALSKGLKPAREVRHSIPLLEIPEWSGMMEAFNRMNFMAGNNLKGVLEAVKNPQDFRIFDEENPFRIDPQPPETRD